MDIYAILLSIFLIGSLTLAAYCINKASKEGIAKSGDPKPIRPRIGFDPVPEEMGCEFCDSGNPLFAITMCDPCIDKLAGYDIQKIAFADFHRQIGNLQKHIEAQIYCFDPDLGIINFSSSMKEYLKAAQVGL